MECECRPVSLDLIDDADEAFRISFGRPGGAIEESIRQVGLIHSPILLTFRERYRVVSGFERIAACRRLGWTQIAGRCLPAGIRSSKCALLAIADNAGQRELNIVEQARALGLIDDHDDLGDERIGILHSLGISVSEQWVRILKQVVGMPDRLQSGLVDNSIGLPVALRLHGLKNAAAAEDLARMMQELRLGLNRQRELLDWVQEIALREDLTISDIVNQDPIAQWRKDETKDRAHIAKLIRDYLRKRRYPEISASEGRYQEFLKKLKISKNIHLTPPPFFEGKTYQLRIDFQTRQDLRERNQELQNIIESPFLIEILSPSVPRK